MHSAHVWEMSIGHDHQCGVGGCTWESEIMSIHCWRHSTLGQRKGGQASVVAATTSAESNNRWTLCSRRLHATDVTTVHT